MSPFLVGGPELQDGRRTLEVLTAVVMSEREGR